MIDFRCANEKNISITRKAAGGSFSCYIIADLRFSQFHILFMQLASGEIRQNNGGLCGCKRHSKYLLKQRP